MPRLPSEIWNLLAEGYTEEQCRDFDFAHLDFLDWLEAKRNEQKWVTSPKTPKGKTQVPKYTSDHEIIALYYPEHQPSAQVDPVAEAVTDEDLMQLMDDLDIDRSDEDATGQG